jgi:hypothetical protein
MTLVVAGPRNKRFATLVTNIVANGAKTLHPFTSANTPENPDAAPRRVPDPGYVKARTTGRAV